MSYDVCIIDECGKTMLTDAPHKLRGGNVRCDENLQQIAVTLRMFLHYRGMARDAIAAQKVQEDVT